MIYILRSKWQQGAITTESIWFGGEKAGHSMQREPKMWTPTKVPRSEPALRVLEKGSLAMVIKEGREMRWGWRGEKGPRGTPQARMEFGFYSQWTVKLLEVSSRKHRDLVYILETSLLTQGYPNELPVVLSCTQTIVKCNSHWPRVATEHLKCGWCDWESELFTWF